MADEHMNGQPSIAEAIHTPNEKLDPSIKGPTKPIVNSDERLENVSHLSDELLSDLHSKKIDDSTNVVNNISNSNINEKVDEVEHLDDVVNNHSAINGLSDIETNEEIINNDLDVKNADDIDKVIEKVEDISRETNACNELNSITSEAQMIEVNDVDKVATNDLDGSTKESNEINDAHSEVSVVVASSEAALNAEVSKSDSDIIPIADEPDKSDAGSEKDLSDSKAIDMGTGMTESYINITFDDVKEEDNPNSSTTPADSSTNFDSNSIPVTEEAVVSVESVPVESSIGNIDDVMDKSSLDSQAKEIADSVATSVTSSADVDGSSSKTENVIVENASVKESSMEESVNDNSQSELKSDIGDNSKDSVEVPSIPSIITTPPTPGVVSPTFEGLVNTSVIPEGKSDDLSSIEEGNSAETGPSVEVKPDVAAIAAVESDTTTPILVIDSDTVPTPDKVDVTEIKSDVTVAVPEVKSDVAVATPEMKSDVTVPAPEVKSDVTVAVPEVKSDVTVATPEVKSDVTVPAPEVKSDVNVATPETPEVKSDSATPTPAGEPESGTTATEVESAVAKEPKSIEITTPVPETTVDTPVAETAPVVEAEKEPEWLDILGNGLLKKKIIKKGRGEDTRPLAGDLVTVRCEGKLENGTIVDKNDKLQFILSDEDVIQAFDLAVALMEDKEIATVYTDARYAYGVHGRSDCSPPVPQNASLTYEVEVLSVEAQIPLTEMSVEARVAQGDKKRLRGNALYERGDYSGSINAYKRGIKYLDGSHQDVTKMKIKCLNNLSAAQLKVKAYRPAIQSLDTVLHHEPENVKALFRKGKCLDGLEKEEEAMECIKKASLLDPHNKTILQELGRLRSRVAVTHQKEKEMYQRMFQSSKEDELLTEEEKALNWSLSVTASIVGVLGIVAGWLWYKNR